MSSALGTKVSVEEIDEVTTRALQRWGIPGATLGISLGGETIERAYGIANLETQQPVLTESIFRLASISKPFTATLAMTLVDEGLLDLDLPIAAYLPAVVLRDATARTTLTMRHLLSHTGGIDCEFPTDVQQFGSNDDALPAMIEHYDALRQWTQPGELWSYCNTGFWLAGATIAAITGMPFERAMRERVFAPLGLERACYAAEEAIVHPVALGHNPVSAEGTEHALVKSFAYPRVRRPSGGVIASARDVLRFAEMHMGLSKMSPLSDESRLTMQQPQVRLRQTTPDFWGIGWEVNDHPQGKVIGHGGSFGGYQTHLAIVPEQQFAFVVLTNSARGSAAFPAIKRYLLETFAGIELRLPQTIEVPSERLKSLAGHYENGNTSVEISNEDGRLKVVAATENEISGKRQPSPAVYYAPIDERELVALDGPSEGSRLEFFDWNDDDAHFARVGLRIVERLQG
jgi:CubicO group peptidase (beta-lactamase class C family)